VARQAAALKAMNDPKPPAVATFAEAAVELEVDGHHYWLHLPNAATDYIQKKVATERQPYEPDMLADMRRRLQPGDLVIDAGANVGNHTIYLAAVVGCRVEAFEADSALCTAIRESIALNELGPLVRVHAVGLGVAPARAHFGTDRPDNLGARALTLGDGEIDVVALDSQNPPRPVRALKVDVEGMEFDVLRGAETLICGDRPILYVECISERDFRTVASWLDTRAYVHWDTFNATPTHLFLPAESVTIEQRLARLQLKLTEDGYKHAQLAGNIRQKMTRAYEQEREVKVLNAALAATKAALSEQLETLRTEHRDISERRDRERRAGAAKAAADAARIAELESQIDPLRTTAAELRKQVATANAQAQRERDRNAEAGREHELLVETMRARIVRLEQQYAELRDDRERLQRTLESEVDRSAAAGREHELLAETMRARIVRLEQQHAELRNDRERLQRTLETKSGRADALAARVALLGEQLEQVRASASFLAGSALVASTRSASGAFRLPLQLWRIFRERRRERRTEAVAAKTARAPAPAPAAGVAAVARPPHSLDAEATKPATAITALPRARLRRVDNVQQLRVACIFDEFTYHSFAPECDLLQLRADTWQAQVDAFKPDFVFVESAWRGGDDTWHLKVSTVAPELIGLLEWAGQTGVPTAFWCKEDPVHFVRFMPVARLVDHVFTTDIDCIPRYMAALGHRRVHLLPFAAQPALHHPVETIPREDAFCFAGSYYRKYPERQVDFHALVEVGRKLRSVVIYDRNSRRPQPHDFNYPDEYRAELRDALDYAEVDRAYKGYRYGITVNTIKQSQTMFARRAFELMACNTVVVSNFSRGLRMFFGDLVVSSDDRHELARQLTPVCADDRRYRALRLYGLRAVLSQHTYAHRIASVASCLSGHEVRPPRPRVALVAEVVTTEQARRVVDAVARQTWSDGALILVGPADTAVAGDGARYVADRSGLAPALAGFDHVAVLDPDDHHGPDYLGDLALATTFARGTGVTKAAHFRWTDGTATLVGDSNQYKPCPAAVLRRSLVRVAPFVAALADAGPRLGDTHCNAPDLVAVDEFGYCAEAHAGGSGFASAAVEAVPPDRPPVDLAGTVLRAAEATQVPQTGSPDAVHLSLSADEIVRLLPRRPDSRVTLSRDAKRRIVVESTLGETEHAYLYLSRRFAPAELVSGTEMRVELEAEGPLDACTVFVFRNAAEQKISQLTDRVGAPHALRIPAGTDHVRLALRVQGPGRVAVGDLRVVPAPQHAIVAIPAARHLVVTRNYPAYDDLYRYAFVHSRVRAYARAGQPAHVLRLASNNEPRYREFDDVDVVEGNEACLEQLLAGRGYADVMVHAVDPRAWEVLHRLLDDTRIVLWAHGAELQPWWRRAFTDGEGSAWAKQTNDARLAMWRDILRLRHRNLSVVFVSRRQLEDALADLRLHPSDLGHVEIIHNAIDTDRFVHVPKPPEQRLRVLSIRPYASRVYANDLAVQAILLLADEPFFGEMRFSIVGDGLLFDETVAPLRRLPNVEIHKGFVPQWRIAELHREHGIFLVPSRMDSQGVSRDEAMASGLVPVTNRVAAVPEFVDASCGFLAEPEDAQGLAEAIAALVREPARFAAMSAAAARRVRSQSGPAQTTARELALVAAPAPAAPSAVVAELDASVAARQTIAIYGDVNLNVLDGSSVWAASLAETLAGVPDLRVVLLLKARVKRTLVISRLLHQSPQVQLVEPVVRESGSLTPAQAVAEIVALDVHQPLHGIVLRGLQVCAEASRVASLHGRLWAYLTDIPQRADDLDATTRATIAAIVAHSRFVLCQTPQMGAYLGALFPQASDRIRILPPMIPPPGAAVVPPPVGPFRLAYAGKFAPDWGIEEMFDAFAALRVQCPDAELHVYGDKIHQSTDGQSDFREMVQRRLAGDPGVRWHGAVDRGELMHAIARMHACWAFRNPAFERDCLELSTKALEYASLQVPVVLARGKVNESVFGADYPLFADSGEQAAARLRRLAAEPTFRNAVASALQPVARRFEIPAVRALLTLDGLLPSSRAHAT
jgi:FkbM family methyltransferase